MTLFTVGEAALQQKRDSNFEEFVAIAKGRSIISALDFPGQGRLELGLSGGAMLRFFFQPPIEANLVSTVNSEEIPPVVVAVGQLPQQAPLWMIESKLRGLRTLYAIFFLTENGRSYDLGRYLTELPEGDIERDLLSDDERLFIESISYGSWVVAVWTKTKGAVKSLSSVVGLAFGRGREAYLASMEANTLLKQNEAKLAGIKVEQAEFDFKKSQVDYLIDVSNRLDAPEIKEQVKRRMLNAVDALTLGDSSERNARARLEGPKNP